MKALPLLALLLVGCSSERVPDRTRSGAAPTGLEQAAIEAGVIADPANTDLTGLFARETDRVCIVPTASAWRIGVFVDYGDQQGCSGSGTVNRVGERLRIEFPGAKECSFEARFEGDRIVFPGRLPDGCDSLCTDRTSIAALDVGRLSESVSEASTLRDGRGKLLCAGGG